MPTPDPDHQCAAKLWHALNPSQLKLALLTTASGEGVPHATWKGAILASDPRQILTITSPESP